MAEGKKGFILYADYKESFDELSNDDAGQLIKHIFKYVNDENPETKNKLVKISFIPIKRQLKRDLEKYEGIKEKRSAAGKESARLRAEQKATNPTLVESVQQSSTNPTVIVNDTVNVNDTVTVNDKESVINLKTPPALISFRNNVFKEAKEMNISESVALKFFEYWSAIEINSKQFLFQVTDNFALTNKLKGWIRIESENKKENYDYKEDIL